MLQKDIAQQKKEDVFSAYEEAIARLGEEAKYVNKSVLLDEAMKGGAPRFYVSYERAARIISLFRKGVIPTFRQNKKLKMYRDIYALFISKTDGSISSLRSVLEMRAPSFYINKRRFLSLVHSSLKNKR